MSDDADYTSRLKDFLHSKGIPVRAGQVPLSVTGPGVFTVYVTCEPDDEPTWRLETDVDGKLDWNRSSGSPQDLLDQVEKWVRTQVLAKGNKQPGSLPKWRPAGSNSLH